jgi:hypothetical protein
MKFGFFRSVAVMTLLLLASAAPARAQDITDEIISRYLRAEAAMAAEVEKVGAQVKAIDAKIEEWRKCAELFQAAGEVGGQKMGLAAKAAMKAKCGATSEEGFLKDKQNLLAAGVKAAIAAGGFKEAEYNALAERFMAYMGGRRGDFFKPAELAALDARKADLIKALGPMTQLADAGGEGGGGRGAARGGRGGGRLPSTWGGDMAWEYIGYMFTTMYISGATMFEKPYQPGEWTRWQLIDSSNPEEKTVIERAFIGKTAEGSEWWRTKSLVSYQSDTGATVTDTVVLEGLFKPLGEMVRQLVRMRGKLPGDKEPRELLVPQFMSMLTTSIFPFKPTEESIQGATVGTETVAGVSAKHVKFSGGSGGATIEWWLSDAVPGGWVKFTGTEPNADDDKPATWTLELVGKGTGAKSELGVM